MRSLLVSLVRPLSILINYKGSTLDSIIELENGHIIKASEFFDEEDPSFDYKMHEAVKVSWVDGWEWLLPNDTSTSDGTADDAAFNHAAAEAVTADTMRGPNAMQKDMD